MFFVIAGMQPRTMTLDAQPRRCPRCGLDQAVHQRIDHYVSLFFIPLVRVKKGAPFLFCRRCQQAVATEGFGATPLTDGRPACAQCGAAVDPGFAFCPHCGRRMT